MVWLYFLFKGSKMLSFIKLMENLISSGDSVVSQARNVLGTLVCQVFGGHLCVVIDILFSHDCGDICVLCIIVPIKNILCLHKKMDTE